MNKQRRAISIVSITLALIVMTTLMIGTIAFAAPTSDMLVMDNADMLTNEDEAKIENALYQIYEQTNIEYAIYLAPSLDGKTIEEASLETGRKLGIGDKEDNTGLFIYVALADREFRMEVGMIVVIVFIVVLCVASAFIDGGSGSLSSGRYYSSGYSSNSSSSGSFGGGSFGGGGASGGW